MIVYNLMCEQAKILANILNKSVLHKAGSKTTLSDLHKFFLFHLMENLPFDFPYTIYINILRNLKGLGGLNIIYYASLINMMLWEQSMYQVFNKMDDDSKHTLIAKGLVVAKKLKFSKTNLKDTKVALEHSEKDAPQVDLIAINKRKQKGLAKAIADEDQGVNNFGISKNGQKIMAEKQKKNKTRKHSQKEEEEEDKMKKRHEQSTASIPVHLVAGTSILQRLKDLNDAKEEAMKSLCESHNDIWTLMTALELRVSDWEDKWIDVYFDISSKLLDICNAFSSELSRLNQGNLPLKSSASFNELKQLHKELGSSHSHKKHKRHRTENGNDIGKVVGNFVQSVDINKELSLGHVKFDQFKRQQSGSGNSYQDDENFSQQLDVLLGMKVKMWMGVKCIRRRKEEAGS
ncbi:hypothetical protein JHK85_000942 [Glycine max]|nr:hypothetical protein JHK85_000942 [Glycine max]